MEKRGLNILLFGGSMKIAHFTDIEPVPVTIEGAKNATMRVLIGKKDGAKNFIMRLFEIAPEGFTPFHHHPFEHELFVIEGNGALVTENKEIPFNAGSCLFVEAHEMHRFKNTGDVILKLICLIPEAYSSD